MTMQSFTLHIPGLLYHRLKRRAEQSQRTIEDEMLEAIATAIHDEDELPADLEEALSSLSLLDDQALWQAARSHLPVEAATRLENLHLKRQSEGLTETETQTLSRLVREYERAMLVRARAAVLLKQRGCDVSILASQP